MTAKEAYDEHMQEYGKPRAGEHTPPRDPWCLHCTFTQAERAALSGGCPLRCPELGCPFYDKPATPNYQRECEAATMLYTKTVDERDALLQALALLDQAENGPWDGEEQKRHLRTAWSVARSALAKHGR